MLVPQTTISDNSDFDMSMGKSNVSELKTGKFTSDGKVSRKLPTDAQNERKYYALKSHQGIVFLELLLGMRSVRMMSPRYI